MRRLVTLILIVFVGTAIPSFSQDFGEKWIVNGQRYYKIKTAENGMYRISYQDLVNAGFPVTTAGFNKRRIQLFHRGVEQAIYIPGAIDGALGNTEYVEFYGKKNDGTLDTYLYKAPEVQPHNYYNLYSDTTAFFLTYAFGTVSGKRMEVKSAEFNTGGLPKEPYHLEEKLSVFTGEYSEGQYYPLGSNSITLLPEFDTGEGWTGGRIAKAASANFPIADITNSVASGPKPLLEVLLVGRNNRKHNVSVSAGSSTSSLRSIKNIEFDYYAKAKISENIEFSDISTAGQVTVNVRVNGFSDANTDYASVSYIKLLYPQTFAMSGASKVFNVAPNPNGKSFVEISNAGPSVVLYDITDLNSIKRLNYFISGSSINTVVSETQSGRKLLAVNNDYKAAALKSVMFRTLNVNANYLIISHPLLRKPVGDVADPVKAYSDYRASAQGGSFDTLTINIDQLYDQFTYGEITPLAVRRFADYMLNYGNPKNLFLIGKGLNVSLKFYRTAWPFDNIHKDFIPPIGFPASDVKYTSGLKGTGLEPAIPTGRIAARSPAEVLSYLNKVKEMEGNVYDDLWHKNLIHLSGGLQVSEVDLFKSYVRGFGNVAEGKYLGGDVFSISKTSNLNVEFINIAEHVNKGASMITFFGHSAPDVTDIEIGKVSDEINGYNNKGKYPMIYVNGCDAGDIFNSKSSLGEDWTLTPDKGAIAFYAFSHLAYAGPLKRFADIFYETTYGDSVFVNKSIGEVNQEVVKRFLASYSNSELYITQAQEMILQGDPAYKLFNAPLPDYNTSDNLLYLQSYDGKTITALTDSFALGVIVRNLGRVSGDSIHLQVKRSLESGSQVVLDTTIASVYYQDTILVNIKALEENAFGLNKFEVTIDPGSLITELNELNNIGTIEYFMPLTKVITVVPNEFSIVNTAEVMLVAQNTETVKTPQQYLFEIDTAYAFNSGWKKQHMLSTAAIPTWKVAVSQLKDTTVYYWRVKINDNNPDNIWATSSFTYILNGPEGWTQNAFPQMLKNGTTHITKNLLTRKLEFEKVESKFTVTTHGNGFSAESYKQTELFLNEFPHVFEGRCGNNRLMAVAFNKVTAEPYLLYNKISYGSGFYCGRTFNEIANRMTDAQIKGSALLLEDYIDKLPTGDFALFFTSGLIEFETWPETTKAKLEQIGVDLNQFNKLKNGYPYIVFGQKGGAIGSAIQILPAMGPLDSPLTDDISFSYTVTGQHDRGVISSSKIGPSVGWDKFFAKTPGDDINDIYNYDIVGLDINNNEQLLVEKTEDDTVDLSFINSTIYPNLIIRANVKDSVKLTPPQLKRWQVNFTAVPEGIAYIVPGQKIDSLTVEEGEELTFNYVYKNVSNKPFTDSIAVQETHINHTSLDRNVVVKNYKPLPANDSINFSISENTFGKVGLNTLQAYVNPKIQKEQNYFNNIISLNKFLTVKGDGSNPLLDVVFDGVHIMDGDIVSPSPLIGITLKDENKYRFKKDTVGLEIFVKQVCEGCGDYQRIAFSNPDIKWQPADETNKFKIDYQPKELSNGRYALLVQGSDESGNKSGVAPYEVSFEIINESTISNFYPYPNPFSTKTRFVFRLTGREIPDEIKVIIMTISGKVVREIDQNELGPIKIGDNKTEFFWDGTDQYGDRLANGVYLYKVTVKNGGVVLDHRDTKGDKGFKKGFGKMYILR